LIAIGRKSHKEAGKVDLQARLQQRYDHVKGGKKSLQQEVVDQLTGNQKIATLSQVDCGIIIEVIGDLNNSITLNLKAFDLAEPEVGYLPQWIAVLEEIRAGNLRELCAVMHVMAEQDLRADWQGKEFPLLDEPEHAGLDVASVKKCIKWFTVSERSLERIRLQTVESRLKLMTQCNAWLMRRQEGENDDPDWAGVAETFAKSLRSYQLIRLAKDLIRYYD
jgi:hypothetical protein